MIFQYPSGIEMKEIPRRLIANQISNCSQRSVEPGSVLVALIPVTQAKDQAVSFQGCTVEIAELGKQ